LIEGSTPKGTASNDHRLEKNIVETLSVDKASILQQGKEFTDRNGIVAALHHPRRALAILGLGCQIDAKVVLITLPFPNLNGEESG